MKKLTKEDAEKLAEDIYKAVDEQAYAKEIARILKKHGLVNLKDVAEWVARKEKEEGAH